MSERGPEGDGLVVFADDVDTEFLSNDDERDYLSGIE
jgi:hypothetical protein